LFKSIFFTFAGEDCANYFYWLSPEMEEHCEQTNLHFAAMTGQCKVVELKLEQENGKIKKENIVDRYGRLPLHYAAEKGHTYVFMALLKVADDKNPQANSKTTPLHLAAENGHLSIVKIILENVDAKNPKEKGTAKTPLYWAVTNNHSDVWR
jgi:ankyrin repeat protein